LTVASLDPDVAAAAALLVARYGDVARLHAVYRLGKLTMPGDHAARSIWFDVVHAIDELQGQRDAQTMNTLVGSARVNCKGAAT
jgi:hypothetical protein